MKQSLKTTLCTVLLLASIVFTKTILAQTGATCASPLSLTISPGSNTGWQSTSLDTIWYDFTAPNPNCNFRFHTSLANKKCVKNIKYGVCGVFANQYMLTQENDTTFYLTFVNLTASSHYKLALAFGASGHCTGCSNIGAYKIDFVSSGAAVSSACGAICPSAPDCNYLCNGSFEQTFSLPQSINQIHLACDWTSANNGSPELFSSLPSSGMPIPSNGFGCENVRVATQTGYAGFGTDPSPSLAFNEAIYAPFPIGVTMQNGATYNVTFYLSLAENSSVNATNIGFAFANSYIPNPSTTAFGSFYTPVPINTSGVSKSGWTAFSYNYTANGNETDFIIGAIDGTSGVGTSPLGGVDCAAPGWEFSYYYIDDISINQVINAVASTTSICGGGTTTLTATGGSSTYTWSTGANTPTISVSPTVTTIYTVTSTNSFGCLSTATVMVTVNSSYCCQTPVKVFTTGNWSAQTASTSVGAILIEINGTVTMDANVTMTKSIVRMAPNAKIIIAPTKTLTLIGAHLFSCNYMWEGIEMSNNSGLVTNRATLPTVNPTLDDANVGIYSNSAAMGTPASIVLNYLQFSKNHIGVKVENYASTTPYPFGMGAVTIQGNIGTTYSPGTILKTYLSPTPINYASTEYGVLLEDVNAAAVGSSTGARNTFKNLQNGVRMVRSNAHVIRNDFLNLYTGYSNKAIWATGDITTFPSATYPTLGYGTKHRYSVGIGTSNYCTFKNLKYGVYADSCMTNYIQNNTFQDVSGSGISINRGNFYRGYLQTVNQPYLIFYDRDTTSIITNNMAPSGSGSNLMQNGITMNDNYYHFSYIDNNSINLKPASNVWSTGIGIYHGSTNYNSAYITISNLITGTGNYGIHELNDAALYATAASIRGIAGNTITVGTGYCAGFFDTPNVGIYSVNSPYAVINENIIDETSLGSAPACMIGVYISNGQADNIGCNLMKNNDISCAVDLNNINSVYRGNVMNTALVGLYRVNGSMGNIGSVNDAAQNEWYSTSFSTYVANSLVPSNIYYDYSIGARNPNINGFVSPDIPFTPVLTTAGTLGCTQHHKGGNNSQIQLSSENDGLVTNLINGSVQFPQYHEGLLWEHRNGILNLLKDSLLDNDNALFAQFRQQQSTTNLGKINSLMRSIGNYADVAQNKNTYLQELNAISTSTIEVEQNYQLFLNEYINNIAGAASVNGTTYHNIKQLAQKCPYSDGAVVYNARALMKILGDDVIYHNACEMMQIPNGNGEQNKTGKTSSSFATENVMVYPNPNNGTFSIAFTFEDALHTFELYDIVGKKVSEKILSGNEGVESISLNRMDSGVYFYKITDTKGRLLFSNKLIINK